MPWLALVCQLLKTEPVLNIGATDPLAPEEPKQRYTPQDPSTLEQIKNLHHGCCVVMLR